MAFSPNAITAAFKNLNVKYGIGSLNEQSYCYSSRGINEGYRIDALQRIASVSKLITTYFASETLDIHKKYKTKIYLGKDSMHIEGGNDPYFDADKLLLLFEALNKRGYKAFKNVTFNKAFLFYNVSDRQVQVTPEITRLRLSTYLSSKNLTLLTYKWRESQLSAIRDDIRLSPKVPRIISTVVRYSEQNPLIDENLVVYFHESKPLHSIVKSMNIESNNYIAQNVFNEASSIKHFNDVMNDIGINPASFKIFSGSGLPVMTNPGRLDNMSTCSTVLKIISLLPESLQKHNLRMSDVLAVSGKDNGTLAGRFSSFPDARNVVIAKTGTLRNTSSLAGVVMSEEIVPFVILNHTYDIENARKVQDMLVNRIISDVGGPNPISYERLPVFPWDNSNFLTEDLVKSVVDSQ